MGTPTTQPPQKTCKKTALLTWFGMGGALPALAKPVLDARCVEMRCSPRCCAVSTSGWSCAVAAAAALSAVTSAAPAAAAAALLAPCSPAVPVLCLSAPPCPQIPVPSGPSSARVHCQNPDQQRGLSPRWQGPRLPGAQPHGHLHPPCPPARPHRQAVK
eukprot:1159522-Pelagomonas_calceolata.AAC.7